MRSSASLLAFVCISVAACSSSRTDGAIGAASVASSSEIALLSGADADAEGLTQVDWAGPVSDAVWAAVVSGPGYRRALASARAAASSVDIARSARRPQASVNVQGGRLNEIGGSDYSGAFGGATISQLIMDGGASAAAVDAAAAEALTALQELKGVANSEALASASGLVSYVTASRRLSLLDGRVTDLGGLLGQVERMAQSGIVNSSALDSARRQLLDIEMERARLAQSRDVARREVERRFGSAPPAGLDLSGLDAHAPRGDLGDAWALAPDVVAAASALVGAQAELRRSRASFSPRASLQSRYNSPLQDSDTSDVSVGLSVEYVIGSGGRRVADVERAEAAVEGARAALEAARDGLLGEIGDIQSQIELAASSIGLLEERVRLLSDEAASARSQIATGQVSLGQVIEGEVALYRASDQLMQYRAELAVAKLTLAARLGLLDTALGANATGGRQDGAE